MRKPKVLNPPKELWLCYGDFDGEIEHIDCGEVSWCDGPQDAADVLYVLAPKEQKP